MKKSSVAVTLAILGPALLAGCRNSDDENSNEANQSTTSGYRGGGGSFVGSRARSSSPRGGFGGFGRMFSGGS